jgi:DNA-binding NtrC family response regulator
VALDRFERSYVPKLLERAGGVVARAAEAAQIARPSFYRILERLRLPGADEG